VAIQKKPHVNITPYKDSSLGKKSKLLDIDAFFAVDGLNTCDFAGIDIK
jgi:hypothetical protein